MGLFTMIFYLALAGIVAETAVKLIRGHPAKKNDMKALQTRVDELEQRMGDCLVELDDTRTALAEEVSWRTELEERLDFTERMLASGREARPSGPEE